MPTKPVHYGRMVLVFLMGVSSGLPLMLFGSTLKAWMTESHIDLTTIGLFAMVGIPYSCKFLWAPLIDRYSPPFLGRRRGWLLITQLALMTCLLLLSLVDPVSATGAVAVLAFAMAVCGASQDIVIDAYRREILEDHELGLGTSLAVNGYRIGMLLTGAFALWLSTYVSWGTTYRIMASLVSIGLLTTLIAPEPDIHASAPKTLRDAVILPFVDFFRRSGAILILLFILFYKLGDNMASEMLTPFYLQIGIDKPTIAGIAKSFGLFATLAGGLFGGVLMLRLGQNRSLWIFGVLQAVSTAGFSWLAVVGPQIPVFAAVVTFENFTAGMGMAALAALMASLTNRRFTATQFALLSSFMGLPRSVMSAPSGWIAKNLGWPEFFLACTVLAIPGMYLLRHIAPWNGEATTADSSEQAA